jgi:hypothetical protein
MAGTTGGISTSYRPLLRGSHARVFDHKPELKHLWVPEPAPGAGAGAGARREGRAAQAAFDEH